MSKIQITAYTDKGFSKTDGKPLVLQINPKAFNLKKGIHYQENRQAGDNSASGVFDRYDGEKLSLEILIDCTGVVPGTKENDNAYLKVDQLEKLVYAYKGEAHRPAFVEVAWGDLIFKGQTTKFEVDYTLFDKNGVALRATVKLELANFTDEKTAKKKADKRSPDMSHLVVVREGDTLPALCRQFYDDSTLADQVARINGLNGFRRIPPGTELLFPHLKKG